MSVIDAIYPIVILQHRYGLGWVAIADAEADHEGMTRGTWCMDNNGPTGPDQEAYDFWREPPVWAACGDTPDKALAALIAKQ